MKSRGFVFTHNNPIEGDCTKLNGLKGTTYGILGRETGSAAQTDHVQGYLYFKAPRTQSGVRKLLKKTLGKEAWVEAAKGGPESNRKYCSKDGDYEEWGEPPRKGKRSDLIDCARMLDEGKMMVDVAEEHPGTYIRYHRGLSAYQGLTLKKKSEGWRQVEVIFITGPTGCGKTKGAMEEPGVFKIQGSQLKWWDGYEGQTTILIDEYANDVKVTELLALLDGYQLRLEIKGGFTYACWTKVYITSNLEVLHDQAKDVHLDALKRRITKTKSYWVHTPFVFPADNEL